MRYARQERLEDHSLCDAIERMERGLVDADLGGGIINNGWREQGKAVRVVTGY